jgi:flagellar hook-associated protein 3 FlgL
MRITEGMRYSVLLQDIGRAQERVMKAQQEVSSGKKISTPSEDPVAAADVLRLHGEISENGQYLRNLTFAKSKLQTTDVVLDNVEQLVLRARTLAQSSFGNPQAAQGYLPEVIALRDQIVTAANTTHAGRFIFGGSVTTTQPYVKNPNSTVTYNGNSEDMPLEIERNVTVQTQIAGSNLFSGSVNIFQVMDDLATAMQSGNNGEIDAQIKNLEQFADVLSVARTNVGSNLNFIANVESNHSSAGLSRQSQLSQEESADLATAISELTLSQNALQATLAVGAKISQISILDYLR